MQLHSMNDAQCPQTEGIFWGRPQDMHARHARHTYGLLPRAGTQRKHCSCMHMPLCPLASCMCLRRADGIELSFTHCCGPSVPSTAAHARFSPPVSRSAMTKPARALTAVCALRNLLEGFQNHSTAHVWFEPWGRTSEQVASEPDLLVRWPTGQITHAKHRLALLQRERAVGPPCPPRSRSR